CAPGAGRGSPGCFLPALAVIELNGDHLGVDPATCDPSWPADRHRYPILWGLLVREAAHARHTRWLPPTGARAAGVEAALWLGESRAEAAHLRRRPRDQPWLRAAARHLVLNDCSRESEETPQVAMTSWEAGRAAALLLAREEAG